LQWIDIKNQIRASMDELTSRGVLLANIKVADILAKSKHFINPILFDLASTTAKLAKTQNYTLNPLCNLLSQDTSSIKKHLPGVDVPYELVGAKACFFECSGPATVTIDEKIDGVWTNIETITILASTTNLTEYKRLISTSSPTNSIRLNFSGNFSYDYRNYILYPYDFPDEASIQQHRPAFEFDLPSDYLMLDQWMAKSDARQYRPYSNVSMLPTRRFAINRYEAPLELQLVYWRKPTLLTFTGVDTVDDIQVLDCTEDAAQIVSLGVTASCLISEKDETGGMVIRNMYEVAKATLPGNDDFYAANFVVNSEW